MSSSLDVESALEQYKHTCSNPVYYMDSPSRQINSACTPVKSRKVLHVVSPLDIPPFAQRDEQEIATVDVDEHDVSAEVKDTGAAAVSPMSSVTRSSQSGAPEVSAAESYTMSIPVSPQTSCQDESRSSGSQGPNYVLYQSDQEEPSSPVQSQQQQQSTAAMDEAGKAEVTSPPRSPRNYARFRAVFPPSPSQPPRPVMAPGLSLGTPADGVMNVVFDIADDDVDVAAAEGDDDGNGNDEDNNSQDDYQCDSWEIPRWSYLQKKRLALAQQRVDLEQRLFNYVIPTPEEEELQEAQQASSQGDQHEELTVRKSSSDSTSSNSSSGEDEEEHPHHDDHSVDDNRSVYSSTSSRSMSRIVGSRTGKKRSGGFARLFRRKGNKKQEVIKTSMSKENAEVDDTSSQNSVVGGRSVTTTRSHNSKASRAHSSSASVVSVQSTTSTQRKCSVKVVESYEYQPSKKSAPFLWSGPINAAGHPVGVGRIVYPHSGQVYHGQVSSGPNCTLPGMRHGTGTCWWPNGQSYTGQWHENSRTGRGTHTWPDGRKVTGSWLKGHLHGRVFYTWPDGATYDGDCLHGKKHGRGKHTWIVPVMMAVGSSKEKKSSGSSGSSVATMPVNSQHNNDSASENGSVCDNTSVCTTKSQQHLRLQRRFRVYEGRYENGLEHGYGMLTEADGSKYRGFFHKGQRHGYGMQMWRTTNTSNWNCASSSSGLVMTDQHFGSACKTYDGEWEYNVVSGRGKLTYQNGSCYTGFFRNGLYHGDGCWHDVATGKKYIGSWVDGRKEGHGKEFWSHSVPSTVTEDGKIVLHPKNYAGNYRGGKRHGYGRMTYADGSVYAGGWKHGQRSGRGIFINAFGTVSHCGLWKGDRPVYKSVRSSSSSSGSVVASLSHDDWEVNMTGKTHVMSDNSSCGSDDDLNADFDREDNNNNSGGGGNGREGSTRSLLLESVSDHTRPVRAHSFIVEC